MTACLLPCSTTTRLFASGLTSLLITLLFGKFTIAHLIRLKIGQPIRSFSGFLLAELHKQKKNTPTMGGVLVIASVLISLLLWADWSNPFLPPLVLALILFGGIGMVDDLSKLTSKGYYNGLSGRVRLAIQSAFAAGLIFLLFIADTHSLAPDLDIRGEAVSWHAWLSQVTIPFMSHPILQAAGWTWAIVFFVQWLTIAGGANAVNLTDGLDGLAVGCALPVTILLALVAFAAGSPTLSASYGLVHSDAFVEIAIVLSALAGACLGFLWYNTHPAYVFLGDTGSLAIGGVLGTAAVLLGQEFLFALIGAVFVAETLSVMIQVFWFKRTKKRIFLCSPLHHHFEYAGIPEPKVVVRFWIIGIILAFVGIYSLQAHSL